MNRTHTRSVDFQRFAMRGASASTIIKLMMACNDMQLANEAMSEWAKEQPRNRKYRAVGAKMYFLRLQISHLFEALKVVDEIRKDQFLMNLIGRCDVRTHNSFQFLQQFLPGGGRRKWFEKMVGRPRHNLTFHYDKTGKQILKAIDDKAGRNNARYSSVTRGSTPYLWHLKPADDIVDSIVVRQIWGIPRESDLRTETDKIADEIHKIFLCFFDFSGELIWNYCGR